MHVWDFIFISRIHYDVLYFPVCLGTYRNMNEFIFDTFANVQ